MEFATGTCPKCQKHNLLMFSNNPLNRSPLCFDCIKQMIKYEDVHHADFFCRTYNLPFNPDLWIQLTKDYGDEVFQQYTKLILEDDEYKPNLAYSPTTKDVWEYVNKQWERARSFIDVMSKVKEIQSSYITRARIKWGEQYTFGELIKLDSTYTKTLKANKIINPLQKEAVKNLCKLQVEIDEAIRAKDAKAIKDFSDSYSKFAKQADLEGMINDTKTDDITTVAELYDYMEKSGFVFKYYQGEINDEIDVAIKDIQEANRTLILEETGLRQTLEDMIAQKAAAKEQKHSQEVAAGDKLQEMLDFSTEEEMIIDTESDSDVLDLNFLEDAEADAPKHTVIIRKES